MPTAILAADDFRVDSLTQFALGAAVGTALLGRQLGVRRAALLGGLLGTLPDLDVYLPADDPVESFVGHRGWSHSLVVHAAAAPLIAEVLVRRLAALRETRIRVSCAVFLCLATHALLDAMNVYGTRLFWPLWPEPLGAGSIFIIDPLYIIPLLVVTVWAFFLRDWKQTFGKTLAICLMISTTYLGWTLIGQRIAEAKSAEYLAARGVVPDDLLAGPTPLNSFFWRVIAVDGSDYYHVYVPIAGDSSEVTAYRHARWQNDLSCWVGEAVAGSGIAGRLAKFAAGFYQVTSRGKDVIVSDLRMGLYPEYAFQFAIGERKGEKILDVPARRIHGKRSQPGDWEWLFAGVMGEGVIRPAEAARLLTELEMGRAAAGQSVKAC